MGGKDQGKKKSKAGPILLIVLLAVVGTVAAGYFKPDLPIIGPLVAGFFKKGADGVDKSGVYTVKVTKVVLDPQEAKEGEKLDIQVRVYRVNKLGEKSEVWDSSKYGDNLRQVGKDELAVNFAETPFEIAWESGDEITVEIWDYKGSNKRIARYISPADKKEFGLSGTCTLERMEGDRPINPRVGGTNQIIFEAKRTGEIPPADGASK